MRSEALRWSIRGAGLALGAGTVLLLGALAERAAGVLLLVFLAVLLAAGLEPVIGTVRARTGMGRSWAILLAYTAFLALVAILLLLVVPVALEQAGATWAAVPQLLDEVDTWAAGLGPAGATAVGAATRAARTLVAHPPVPSADAIVETSLTVAEAVVSVATLLVVVFFWLVEHARLQRYVLAFVPHGRRAGWRAGWNRVETRLGHWVRGQLIVMAAIGLSAGIVYALLGLPAALLLGVIAGICEAIPLVGPALGAVPALVVALGVSPATALLVLVAYVVLQLVEGNVLVPLVMRNAVGLSPFLVLVSLLVGGAVGGIVGAFIAVPLVAAIEIVLEPLQARDRPVAPEPHPEGDPSLDRALPDAAGATTGREDQASVSERRSSSRSRSA